MRSSLRSNAGQSNLFGWVQQLITGFTDRHGLGQVMHFGRLIAVVLGSFERRSWNALYNLG